MNVGKVSEADVIRVASDLSIELTDNEVRKIVKEHPSYCEQDPTSTWDLIVEQQAYEIKN